MNFTHTVIITDKEHSHYGQEVPGACVYYDIYHKGDGGPDLFMVQLGDETKNILSTKIDTEHYWNQRRADVIKKLGADVGDKVMILRSGSGSSKRGFDWKAPHVITKIDSSGHVEWDNGEATGFRPDVERVV